jgi:hypothetical protein
MKGWAHFLLVALLTVSQGMDVDPSEFSFGPYEAVRQQVWNYCRSYAAEGLDAYMNCAAQVNQFLCSPLAPDSLLCTTAAMTPYPFPGRDRAHGTGVPSGSRRGNRAGAGHPDRAGPARAEYSIGAILHADPS